jgi:hypothetical protein
MFSEDWLGYFTSEGSRSFSQGDSTTAKLYELLKAAPKHTILSKLVQTFLVTSPHSMQTERVISCHNELKSDLRSSMSRETCNSRLIMALNSNGTANFDPRPAVA